MSKQASTPKRTPSSSRPKGPSEITPGVFVGNWEDAIQFSGVRFCVLDEAPKDMPPATHVRIYDDDADEAILPNLERLAKAMQSSRKKGDHVLVFCGHGIRRSPLAAAWYLHRAEGISLDEAYDRIRSVRPKVEQVKDWIGNPENLDASG